MLRSRERPVPVSVAQTNIQGEVDITSCLTLKIDPGTSKKEDIYDLLKLVAVFSLLLKAPSEYPK